MSEKPKSMSTFLKRQSVLIALFVLIIGFSIASPQFLSIANSVNMLKQVAIYGLMACGMTFVLIGGNFDLTAGALLSFTCVSMVYLHDILGPVLAMLISLLIGIASGCITGFLVGYVKLNSMITTLGMQSILQGSILIFTGGQYASIKTVVDNNWFGFVGRGSLLGVPAQIYIYIIAIIVFQILLVKTVFGRRLTATGGNAEASRYAGINSSLVIMKSYMINGFCVAMAGIVLASRGMAAQPTIGQGFEFDVITACILSGTSLLGGEGSVARNYIGVLIMGVLRTGFVMVGFPYYTQWLMQCVIIVVVVWSDVNSKKRMVGA